MEEVLKACKLKRSQEEISLLESSPDADMGSAMALGFRQGSRKMRGVQSGNKSGSPIQRCCGKKRFLPLVMRKATPQPIKVQS